MPAVSFYLKKEVLDAVRAHARANDIPISRIISLAVENHLKTGQMLGARKRVMDNIRQALSPTGWEALHRERSASDADRD